MSAEPPFKRIALIGLGLIGSSLARGIQQLGLAGELVATDASAQVRARAVEIKLADRIADDNAGAVKDADLVISCVPVGVAGLVAESIGHGVECKTAVQHGLDAGGVQGLNQIQLVAPAAHQQAGDAQLLAQDLGNQHIA